MTQRMGYEWNLRTIMATRGLFSTNDLTPLLAEEGIHLSSTQVYRLVTQKPQRLSLEVLAALCSILECGPQDLIEMTLENRHERKTGTAPSSRSIPASRTQIRRPRTDT